MPIMKLGSNDSQPPRSALKLMKLRNQVLGLGIFGFLMAALVGGVGMYAAVQMSDAFESAINVSLMLSKSQNADMMHDAIRGDVLQALLAAHNEDSKVVENATTNMSDHSKNLSDNLSSLLVMPLPSDIRAVTGAAVPLVDVYITSALRVLELATVDMRAAEVELKNFHKHFSALEVALEAQNEAIANNVRKFSVDVRELASRAKLIVGIGFIVAAGLLLILSLWLSRQLADPLERAVFMAKSIADGKLFTDITPTGNDETKLMMNELVRMSARFSEVVGQIQHGSNYLSLASKEIAERNFDLSTRTEKQASELESTVVSMNQLNSDVIRNADAAEEATLKSIAASTIAQEAGYVVSDVMKTMKDINISSHKISEISSLIDGISFRTNILALNAAVEAARAGEQGRSFAVVASEVRSLAARSAEAAREIKSIIGFSMSRVEQGVVLADKAGSTMVQVVSSIQSVSELISKISLASKNQSMNAKHIDEVVAQLEYMTQQNSALVEQMSTAAESLNSQAYHLVKLISIFDVGGVNGIKAADL